MTFIMCLCLYSQQKCTKFSQWNEEQQGNTSGETRDGCADENSAWPQRKTPKNGSKVLVSFSQQGALNLNTHTFMCVKLTLTSQNLFLLFDMCVWRSFLMRFVQGSRKVRQALNSTREKHSQQVSVIDSKYSCQTQVDPGGPILFW